MKKRLIQATICAMLCSFSVRGDKVFICVSHSSEVYHNTMRCSGIKNCTHEIKEITIDEARKMGRRACKKCY